MTGPRKITDFAGKWQLTRVIHDAKADQVLQADGTACLTISETGLTYQEAVTLRIPGQPSIKGTRTYLWQGAGDVIEIRFEDGRFFHRLKLGEFETTDHHDCPPDSYDVVYDFSKWPRWTAHWTVSGPRKSYEMKTEYAALAK